MLEDEGGGGKYLSVLSCMCLHGWTKQQYVEHAKSTAQLAGKAWLLVSSTLPRGDVINAVWVSIWNTIIMGYIFEGKCINSFTIL